ncbi:hypothetical protein BOJ02_RS05445 [Vibrio parahaemolyticus]|nr:hypothetical protein [Vibrio parahaemolyticus]
MTDNKLKEVPLPPKFFVAQFLKGYESMMVYGKSKAKTTLLSNTWKPKIGLLGSSKLMRIEART